MSVSIEFRFLPSLTRPLLVAVCFDGNVTVSPMPSRLAPGDDAPDFALPTDDGGTVSLSDLRGRKVIVYFYPNAMTPGCTTQACDFSDSLSSLEAAGYTVVGISPNEPAKLAKFRERDGLTIPPAADAGRPGKNRFGAF